MTKKKSKDPLKGLITDKHWNLIDKIKDFDGLHDFYNKLKKKPKTFLSLLGIWWNNGKNK